jgi:retron-type reverse transcriptase
MYTRLLSFLMYNNSINQSQHGFLPTRSTSTVIADLLNNVTAALDKKLTGLVLFIDISKAFDSFDHDILIAKLKQYGIRGNLLSWFRSYLSARYQYTEVNGKRSLCNN